MDSGNQHTKLEKLLLEAARVFNSTLEYEELIELVLKLVIGAVGSEAALVFRVDHDRTDMKIRYINGRDGQVRIFNLELGSGVIGWVANYQETVIINDTAADGRIDEEIEGNVGVKIRSLVSVPLIGRGQMIGVIEAINKLNGEFTQQDLDILIGLSNQIAVAIDNANLYRAVKREVLEKDLLYDISMKLSSSLRLDEVLSQIMNSLKRVVDYNAGGVFLIDPSDTDRLESIYSVGYDSAEKASLHTKMGRGLVGSAAKSGKTVIVPDVSADARYVDVKHDTRSEIVVPIVLDDRIIGVVNLECNRVNAYDQHHESLMRAFASQAAITVERARLHEKLLSGQKIEEQLKIAREIQQTFLPESDPQVSGYDICGRNVPSGQVGGDYYDFIRIVDGQMGIAIGDVVGKGIPAALIMASFRASMIAEIRNNYSIRTICEKVNSLLVESLNPGNFVTAVYGVLDSRNHILTFCNCGHNQPILLRNSGEVEFLKEGGPVLGVTDGAIFEERPLFLNTGEVVVFFTDGVTEVFDRDGREFGVTSLLEVIKLNKSKSAAAILQAVHEAVIGFAAPDHPFDDLTMIVLKRLS